MTKHPTDTQKLLVKAVEAIASAQGNLAAVFDRNGKLVRGIKDRKPVAATDPSLVWLSTIIAQKSCGDADLLVSPEGDKVWVLHVSGFYLASFLPDAESKARHTKEVFMKALPLIAKVSGGEAVLFDAQGILFESVCPDSEGIRKKGAYTPFGHQAMQSGAPSIGPSLIEDGAVAVRIPVTGEFGVGFNNYISVKHRKSLAQPARSHARYTFSHIVGESRPMKEVKERALKIAASASTVLIYGETGTGKELFAQAIHNASPRAAGPFVAINCAALPAALTESLLFGYEGGTFTGARKEGQEGLFEQANKGTLFLDDISEMDLSVQSRFLRVLQEREVVRVGGKKRIPVDVRIIASTNGDLREMAENGAFRKDLFFRLNVVDLRLPLLSERSGDIPLLCRTFITACKKKFGSFAGDISDDAIQCLQSYSWPGNVRELFSVIERTMNLTIHETIEVEDLPILLRKSPSCCGIMNSSEPTGDTPALRERTRILQALAGENNSRIRAAKRLGISTATLWRRMKRLGIPVRQPISD